MPLPPLGLDTSSCLTSTTAGNATLIAGLGGERAGSLTVEQGKGAVLSGTLSGPAGPIGGGWVCVYGETPFGYGQELLGLAATAADGSFNFAVGAGPSRQLTAVYRGGAGGTTAAATATALLQTRVRPSLKLASSTVRNKGSAYFSGRIPGPGNDGVVVVLQVRSGNGWLVFRRYSTRGGGRFSMRYRFTRTFSPTIYLIRAQVAGGPAYPYLAGSSRTVALHVRP